MNIKGLYRHQFEMGRHILSEMLAGLTPEELATPPAPGGNHPLWVLGHLALSEARGLHVRILGEDNPLASWEAMFDQGSTPAEGGRGYPSKDELWSAFEKGRKELLAFIDSQTESDLERPTTLDHPLFNTVGKMLGSLAVHQLFHAGQIACVRQALGKKPVLA